VAGKWVGDESSRQAGNRTYPFDSVAPDCTYSLLPLIQPIGGAFLTRFFVTTPAPTSSRRPRTHVLWSHTPAC
jgi:hypothetical protein